MGSWGGVLDPGEGAVFQRERAGLGEKGQVSLRPAYGKMCGDWASYGHVWGALKAQSWDFPAGSVAKTSLSQCRGPGFDPW